MKQTITNCAHISWETYPFVDEAVLVFMQRSGGDLLLIEKKRGLGAGKYNAPGGRIEAGESPEEAAVRECQEEVFLTPTHLRYVASLQFIFQDGYSIKAFVYFTNTFSGSPQESDEATPFWCPLKKIPYENMWEDDKYWLPLMLEGRFVEGKFIFSDDTMVSLSITASPDFPPTAPQ
ncbi:8-oxo-dGTP diphosphatase [Chitinivibrio alkaliphilus]|uniref:Oxidized purine nucleoside triphosphate hydrolase n=1 Tax=Chitinivibrio alkaliphilus ACht1 TaxID=1313304 RepID=U7D499_9BACT|nr:8-oxo-dGTP diphosphatase [Chitinivibrio alkaliphilus]ERP31324.1 NUDIX hydrolase MTH1 [Chitinivibrio alkaliphilus ACht1]